MNIKRVDKAVSVVWATVLLLVITLLIFSAWIIYSPDSPPPEIRVTITGQLKENTIILEHSHGESLSLDTKILLYRGGDIINVTTAGECLDSKYKADGVWNIGERIYISIGEVSGLQVEISVVEVKSNKIILSGVLKEGYILGNPKGGIWHFNEGTGSIAYDSSDNYNHGTIYGANWTTGISETALRFNGLTDYVKVPNSPGLDITSNITVEAWMKPQDFIENILYTSSFDTSLGYEPNIIHVSGDIYAIAYRGPDNDGFVKTIEIGSNGDITNTIIDGMEFDTIEAYEPNIIHVSGDIYAIAYIIKTNLQGDILTVEIASDGQITDTLIDKLLFESTKCYEPDIIHVIGDIYAIAYRGSPAHVGFVKLIDIWTNGQIVDSIIDEFIFDEHISYEPDMICISGGIFAVVFRSSPAHKGYLTTIRTSTNPYFSGINKMKSFGISASETNAFGIINDQMISGAISSGWNYIVLTYNKSDIRLYSNGTEIASMPYTAPVRTSTNDLLFGYMFYGIIDEVAVYDKTLSPIEILDRYNSLKQ